MIKPLVMPMSPHQVLLHSIKAVTVCDSVSEVLR